MGFKKAILSKIRTDQIVYPFPLQKIQSSEEELLLRSVDLDTTGLYRCEISGEAPLFQTASREAVLAVVGKIFSRFLKKTLVFCYQNCSDLL